jgi:peptide deformylase
VAVKPIRFVPDPVLKRKAKRVLKIDRSIHKLVEDMIDTLGKADGAGLAAPQIGVSLRVCVLWMPEQEPFAIINPQVVKRIGEREIEEGCLSIPGYQGKVKRAVSVTVKGLDVAGNPIRIRAKELLSQALEHEIDHLDGVLYIDRIESPEKLYKIEPKPAQEKPSENIEAAPVEDRTPLPQPPDAEVNQTPEKTHAA